MNQFELAIDVMDKVVATHCITAGVEEWKFLRAILVEGQKPSTNNARSASCAYCKGLTSSYTQGFGPTINYCSHCGRNLASVA